MDAHEHVERPYSHTFLGGKGSILGTVVSAITHMGDQLLGIDAAPTHDHSDHEDEFVVVDDDASTTTLTSAASSATSGGSVRPTARMPARVRTASHCHGTHTHTHTHTHTVLRRLDHLPGAGVRLAKLQVLRLRRPDRPSYVCCRLDTCADEE